MKGLNLIAICALLISGCTSQKVVERCGVGCYEYYPFNGECSCVINNKKWITCGTSYDKKGRYYYCWNPYDNKKGVLDLCKSTDFTRILEPHNTVKALSISNETFQHNRVKTIYKQTSIFQNQRDNIIQQFYLVYTIKALSISNDKLLNVHRGRSFPFPYLQFSVC
ncbi:hypothetical protein BCR32DRAFT_297948 [Anaeromyces robustus]|uniref:Uncharacterized protein n=1 Tax=Anaeromyces robustus TaxID=1754192 RepID=A0A1Y1VVG1_9FUNG|nr:hypothetical protein BCR32DRAFT_297948 [Anaeromyces robustus]|eukprot:ORX64754.1 hypothetical protein BCR32DRAFT_297948 [Anaeromyces robustus]